MVLRHIGAQEDRADAVFHAAQKGVKEVGAIGQGQDDPLFGSETEPLEDIPEAVDVFLQKGVRHLLTLVIKGCFIPPDQGLPAEDVGVVFERARHVGPFLDS